MTRRRKWAIAGALVIGGIVLAPMVLDGEHITLDDALRDELSEEGHRFATTHAGQIHYELDGPAGFPIEATVLARFIRVPLVGDYLMKTFGDRSLAAHNRKYFVTPERFIDFQARFEAQLEVVGSKAAVLSTMRHTPVQSYLGGYERVGEADLPVLIAWGEGDVVFPVSYAEQARSAMPQAELFVVEDAGHLPMLEQPDAVLERLVPFLQDAATGRPSRDAAD